jgi:hypothetical protein
MNRKIIILISVFLMSSAFADDCSQYQNKTRQICENLNAIAMQAQQDFTNRFNQTFKQKYSQAYSSLKSNRQAAPGSSSPPNQYQTPAPAPIQQYSPPLSYTPPPPQRSKIFY